MRQLLLNAFPLRALAIAALVCVVTSPGSYSAATESEDRANQAERQIGATDWLRSLVESGTSEGQVILLDQALQGYAEAQYTLASMHQNGTGFPRDMALAIHWYQRAAGQGHSAALAGLRYLVSEGHSAAFHALGALNRDGLGVPRDPVAAREAFRWAGEGGHIPALYTIAEMMVAGLGGTHDMAAAERHYSEVARHASEVLNLSANRVSEIDRSAAEKLQFSRAVAQYWIGGLYLSGQGGVLQNSGEAARWFKNAAEWGLAEAQYELGRLYARGRGVTRDLPQALHWWKKAAVQGMEAAIIEVARAVNNEK